MKNQETKPTPAVPLERIVSWPMKFRAWYEGEWLQDVRIDLDGSIYPMTGMGEEDLSIDCNKIIITPYIGIKDLSGRCIYVGDIVTQSLYWDRDKKEPVLFEVIYDDFGFKVIDREGQTFLIGHHSTIVGNIFES